jgi:hypothetical protein
MNPNPQSKEKWWHQIFFIKNPISPVVCVCWLNNHNYLNCYLKIIYCSPSLFLSYVIIFYSSLTKMNPNLQSKEKWWHQIFFLKNPISPVLCVCWLNKHNYLTCYLNIIYCSLRHFLWVMSLFRSHLLRKWIQSSKLMKSDGFKYFS